MADLIIPVGIPGCGKSTWTKRFFEIVVSSDAIRADLYDGDYDPSRNSEVFDRFHSLISNHLAFSIFPVVADATNLQASARAKLRILAIRELARIHYIIFRNVGQAIERNTQRDKRWVVPPDAMLRMVSQYEQMLRDIENEPYDSITYIEKVL